MTYRYRTSPPQPWLAAPALLSRVFESAPSPAAGQVLHRLSVGLLSVVVALLGANRAWAQLPAAQLDHVFPLGAVQGSTFDLTIDGEDLDDVDRVLFSHAGIVAQQKMAEPTRFDDGPQPVTNTFVVTVAADVPVGRYEVRCRGKYGLSNARSFVVGDLPDQTEVEPNNDQDTATPVVSPGIINGQASGAADVDWYQISGPPGQPVVIDGFGIRLDSLINLVLTAVDESGQILGEHRSGGGADPVLDVTLPANGQLLLKVHDAQYRQGKGYSYRIVVNPRPQIDSVFPPSAVPGTTSAFTLYGRHLPAGQPTDFQIDGQPVQQQVVQITASADTGDRLNYSGRVEPHMAGLDGFEYRISSGSQISNPLLITLASAPIVEEAAANEQPQTAQPLTVPCEVVGRFYPERDVDWFTFTAAKGDTLAIDLISQRLGLPTDPALLLQQVTPQDDGTEQVRDIVFLDDVAVSNVRNDSGRHEFDTRSTDPSYLFTAPADGTYRLLLRDSYSALHTDPRIVYRLVIRTPEPDYRLVAVPGDSREALVLRREGRQEIRVFALRNDGFDGEIKVHAEGLPAGVTSEDIFIGPSNTMGTLVLTASDQAQPCTASIQVSGSAIIAGKTVEHQARYGAVSTLYAMSTPNNRLPSVRARLTSDLQLCVTDYEPAPALLTIGDGQPIETSRGTSVKVKYTAARKDGIGGTLTGYPINFPLNTTASQVNIGGNKEGEFELRFNANAPAGMHTIYLAGYLQNMPYKRNPEAIIAAQKQQEKVTKIQDDSAKASKDADQAVRDRQNDLNTASAELNTAKSAKQSADQNLTTATAQVTAAQKARDDKQKQSSAAPEDESLKQQLAAAEKTLADATAKMVQAKKAAEAAAKKLTEATAAQQKATAAKAAADQAAAEARRLLQEAQREKQRVDQFVRQKQSEGQQRNINVVLPSNTLNIKLTDFPIELADLPGDLQVKQGDKLEIPLRITRLYDFKTNVSVQLQLPGGVGGISIPNINIGNDQTEGKLQVTTQATATVGTHQINLRLIMNANGQLIMERPFSLRVVEAEQEQK